jgi:alkylhydroperoxidase family enzyme
MRRVSRVEPVPGAETESPYLRVLAHCPEVAERWTELSRTLRFGGKLPPELKEEVRRSTAEQIGCRFCASFGDPKVEHTDEREALAVRFARTVAEDPKLVDDALFDELQRCFTDEELVELVALISFVVVGGQTFGAALRLDPASAEYVLAYEEWLEQSMTAAR